MLPLLLILMKFAKNALDGLDWSASADEMILLFAMNVLMIALSYILFPFLWRS
jgi:heme exporter protein B